uniref:NADH-ubiquinone oxidoreductase chain 4 n=1 Tax=Cyanea capillata TaxID=27804 RepID=G9ISH1_CYACP|nr:NADH dehydrogenase subunit 4 [Cyanea capillata]
MIFLLVTILILSILTLSIIPRNRYRLLKLTGLSSSFLILWISLLMWGTYSSNSLFQINFSNKWIDITPINLKWGPLHFGIDEISIPFIILTGILTPICLLISWTSIKHLVKEFIIFILFIHLLLVGVFTSLNILLFYILFEIILIPMFLIIGIWGSRKEKERAAYYFFFYTLIGSLLMLLAIFAIYSTLGTLDYQLLLNSNLPKNLQFWAFLGFFSSLAVKIPKVPFHIWLPQAHVEAPVAGSVLLAGILLKLGGYGFIRFSWNLFPEASNYFAPIIIMLSSIAIIYASLSTCRQTDAKRLVAYSSVAHMGIVTIAIFSKSIEGIIAAILLMIAHGLISSGLFIMVTNLYDRFHTRLIRYYRGTAFTMPIYSTILFIFILANIAFPISLNFVAEFLSIIAAIQLSWIAIIPMLIGIVLSASYSLFFYNKISFGTSSKFLLFSRDLNRKEFNSLIPLGLLAVVFGLTPLTLISSYNYPFIL